MPYDPSLPANNAPVVSAELRNQFAGLKTLMDACPTTAEMDAAITAQAAGNCLNVDYLALTVSDPPTQGEVEAVVAKLNELLTSLRRE